MASRRLGWTMPATERLHKIFSFELAEAIPNTDVVYRDEVSFWKVFLQIIIPRVRVKVKPKNCDDFFRILDKTLSPFAKKQIIQNLEFFDSLVHHKISDEFITQYTIEQWLFLLCEALVKDPSGGGSNLFSSDSSIESSALSRDSLDASLWIWRQFLQLDKIVQVNLAGPDLITAWQNSNNVVVDMHGNLTRMRPSEISLARSQPPAEINSTSYDGGQFVFHGTDVQSRSYPAWSDSWYENVPDIVGYDSGTQMNPEGVPVVYTGFSALRCFLWAAFKSTIYSNIPSPANLNFMNQQWTARGNAFQGVAVLVFMPPPSGNKYTSFTLPTDKAAPFNSQIEAMVGRRWNSISAWKALRSIHESQMSCWPDVLHCAEFNQQAQALREFPMNTWRSAWHGKGIEVINKSYLFTMAITFQFTNSELAISYQPSFKQLPPPKKDGKEKNTFCRKLRNKVPNIFRR